MSAKRFFGVFFGILGVVLLATVLYVAFADLGRHKTRIEAFVTKAIGRPFVIDGPLKVRLIPVIDVSAEGVRLGNVPGGSQPQMVEIGKVAARIGFWSLISGPPDVRSFDLENATLLLEPGPDGKGNWVMGPQKTDEEAEAEEDADGHGMKVPVIIRSARLQNVRLVYRQLKKPDLVAQLDTLGIAPGPDNLLALDGRGKLDVYPITVKGDVGPLKSLLSARDIRMDLDATVGKLALKANGTVGALDPLDGANLSLEIEQPDVGAMLERLELPVIATGPLRIEGRLKDAGKRTQLDFNAQVGDLAAAVNGTLKTLSLVGADLTVHVEKPDVAPILRALELPLVATGPLRIDARVTDAGRLRQLDLKTKLGDLTASVRGTFKSRSLIGSDLKFEATAADAARLAGVFDIKDVPQAPLSASGHTVWSRKELKFDSVTVALADASVRADGNMLLTGDRALALRFSAAAASLAKLRQTLPQLAVAAHGAFEFARDRIELKDLQATLGKTELAGSLRIQRLARQLEAKLSSPRLDLTPFFPAEQPGQASATAPPAAKPPAAPDKKKFLFSDTALPVRKIKDADASLQLVLGELVLGDRSFKDVDTTLHLDHGKLTFDARAAGTHEGTLQGSGTLVAAADGTADLDVKIDIRDVRASLGNADIAPADVPPLGVLLNLKIHGSSARQMASGANGQLLLTQSSGRTKSGFIAAFGGDFVKQLASKLNPFAKEDPFMKLDCTIARADIVNGQVTVKPVLMQTEKVTVTAHGTIDLHTEKLLLDFDTRPRKGIGVSPGMFTNPLIRLEGTLASPKMGVGAKGVASGALAAATGGATVVAGGVMDRMAGEKDLCGETLAQAKNPTVAKK